MKRPNWIHKLDKYEEPNLGISIREIASSFVPYFSLLAIMYLLIRTGYPYWMVLLLAIPAAGFMIRIFIIFHDCSHNSFFKNDWACTILGYICGVITFTPYLDWQRSHALHHATVCRLDKRGFGDVWLMTTEEYLSASRWQRLQYRIYRNPFFLFIFGSISLFAILYRFPKNSTRKRELVSILITDAALAGIIIAAYYTIGIKTYVAIQLPILWIADIIGVWIFYIHHQFENGYWAHDDTWDLYTSSMNGASFYKLPEVLRWFTGNIGYHYIHHLRPRIHNYLLKKAHEEVPELQQKEPITLMEGFRSLALRLWDEKKQRMISLKTFRKDYGPS